MSVAGWAQLRMVRISLAIQAREFAEALAELGDLPGNEGPAPAGKPAQFDGLKLMALHGASVRR